MGKARGCVRYFAARTLLWGLAGGALSFPGYAAEPVVAVVPPVPASALALAVQSALSDFDVNGSVLEGLKRAETLALLAPDPIARVVPGDRDPEGVQLGMSRALSVDENFGGLQLDAADTDSLPPLKLSQMSLGTSPGVAPPRWMSVPESPTVLRSSRELSQPMPGAAGVGQPRMASPGAPLTGQAADQIVAGSVPAAPASNSGSSRDEAGFSLGAFGWEVPPIRWGGNLGYSIQSSKNNTGGTSTSQGLSASLSASSYIYAPWFARVSGRLGVTSNSSSSEFSGGASGISSSDSSKSANVVGGAEINMFSSTRFPFRAYFDRTDSRASGTIVATDYVSNRFGISQNFRSEDGYRSGNFMFDRNTVSTSDGRSDDVTAMSGSYSMQTGVVQNNFSGRYSLGQRSGTGDQARLIGFNSAHFATISDTLNFGATSNYSDSDIRTSSGAGGVSTNRGRFLQLYGYGSWLPEFEDIEDLPLTLSGGLRLSAQDSQFGSESFAAQSIGANASALYRYSSNLSVSTTAAVNRLTQSQGQGTLLTQLGSAINYTGTPLNFGKFSYNWNASTGANWQSAVASTAANTVLNAQGSHSLSRMVSIAEGQTLSLNASQSLSVINSQMVGAAQTLTHNASANYGLGLGERFSGSLSTSISDVRTSGYLEQEYRILNVGFFGQGQLSQVSTVNVNLMFSWSDQSYQSVDAFGVPITQASQRMTMNGSAAYSHQRFAGVRGLRYNMVFTADTRLRDDRLYGNVNGEIDRARFSLTNRLDYRIGLLDFRLSLMNNEMGGKKNALLFFQVSRQIGSF